MRSWLRRWKNDQRGQAMVEFALSIPFLLLLILACMECAWYFYNRYAVEQYAVDVVEHIPQPGPYISSSIETPNWHKLSNLYPSWLSSDDQELQEWMAEKGNDYDGWVSYAEIRDRLDPVFEVQRQSIGTILDEDRITVSLEGGWLIDTMTQNIMKSEQNFEGGVPTAEEIAAFETLSQPRSEYYYFDMDVTVTYGYRPFSFLGQMIFGTRGDETADITVVIHTEENAGLFLRAYV